MSDGRPVSSTQRVLVKLRPAAALGLAGTRANLEPLYETPRAPAGALGLGAEPQWFVAELPEAAPTAWDLAHAQIAAELGLAPSDVLFAEPDLVHDVYRADEDVPPGVPFAVGAACTADPQDGANGKAVGPDVFAWHLGRDFSQLGPARDEVSFAPPRTRIAHLDTGYYPDHVSTPKRLLAELGRNFVRRDDDRTNAADPDNRRFLLDNSGHGAGTISILAGGEIPGQGVMGGAPEAEVVPLRLADSVVLLRTSAFARALAYAVDVGCAVASMSMGGLPSRAWAEAVDDAYERGLCLCAAAGNHVGPAPPRVLVYPARYARVIAVCGVMADGSPYAGLQGRTLEGSFGPPSVMGSALAAYTPNIPWARFGCPDVVRLNGQGTSSATPQVAAAAALWIERHKGVLGRNHERVEAVRRALFSTAKLTNDREHFGNGVLQAHDALAVRPVLGLPRSERSKNRFAFLRLVTGFGVTEPHPREEMLDVELAQRWLVNPELQEIVPDPDATDRLDDEDRLRRFMEAVIEDPGASATLRRHAASRYPLAAGRAVPRNERNREVVPADLPASEDPPPVPRPPAHRRLRIYAVDPSLSVRLDTAGFNEVTLPVRWEALERQGDAPDRKGPVGEYLEVDDVDAAGKRYQGVDLDDPNLLAQDGWAASEGNPQFHQQMVYAVAMKTIEHFERALGRPVLWRPRPNPEDEHDDSRYVRRLLVRPHALRQPNAFYSPQEVALQFGYFEAAADDPGDHMPGSRVFTCLSHDIVAHETTHAVLDGMHRRFREPTNVDVLAFHEAFADVVALLQHFTLREVLENEISRTRGALDAEESMLGSLAVQFGRAMGARGALRDAIGRIEDGVWVRFRPDPRHLQERLAPHARGAILVAAVFDAFLAIYKRRTADLLRLATGGTGELPAGAIHPDLVRRLADEAAKAAGHLLTMCIRALDYVPPVDVTFFEYLRALITADVELVGDDRFGYRVALVEAFRRRGIYPLAQQKATVETPVTLSVDTLVWRGVEAGERGEALRQAYDGVLTSLKKYADTCFYIDDREKLFDTTRKTRIKLRAQIGKAFAATPEFARQLGLDPERGFEVHALHRSMHVRQDGRQVPQAVISLTQSTRVPADDATGTPAYDFRGGSTLVVDLTASRVKYCIFKRIQSAERRDRTAAFVRAAAADPLRGLMLAQDRKEPFALLHALADG